VRRDVEVAPEPVADAAADVVKMESAAQIGALVIRVRLSVALSDNGQRQGPLAKKRSGTAAWRVSY
jgi:hypothetical protein